LFFGLCETKITLGTSQQVWMPISENRLETDSIAFSGGLYIPLPVLSRQRSIFGSFQDTTQFLPLRPEISKPINEIRLFFQRRSGDLFLQLFYLPDHSVKILCNQADGHESTLEFLAIFFLKKELRPSGNFDIRLFKCQFNGMEDGILGVLPPDKKRFKPTSSLHIPPFILQLHRNNVLQDPSLF